MNERARALRADLASMLSEEGIVVCRVNGTALADSDSPIQMLFDFTDHEFERALNIYDSDAASLWPDRLPDWRPLQLMLVHIEEDLDRMPDKSEVTLRFDAAGYTTVSRRES